MASHREKMSGEPKSPPTVESRLALRKRFACGLRFGLDLLCPPGCTVCCRNFGDDATCGENHLQICRICLEELCRTHGKACPKCGVTLPNLPGSEANCPSCREHRYRFRGAVSIGRYEQNLREAVLRTKHAAEHALGASLARLLCQEAGERIATWQIDAVAPIPMHRWRRWQRGTNHAEVIADELTRQLRLAYAPRMLVRRRNTMPQADLAPSQRANNLRHALRVSKCYSLRAARILLVDDIMTTGSTCNEAARVLLEAGASEVFVAVLARADLPS